MNVTKGGVMKIMDKIEKIDNATIHHGKYSDRLYIMKFPIDGDNLLVDKLTQKAIKHGYSKITGKIPKKVLPLFLENGYKLEAGIPKFYNGKEDCSFVSRFLDMERAVYDPKPLKKFNKVLDAYEFTGEGNYEHNYDIRKLDKSHAEDIVAVFKQVFATYPFPIHDPEYIKETMNNEVVYFGVFIDGTLQSVSSSEMDVKSQNAEMTDFAVLDSARGLGLSKLLLHEMEEHMKTQGMKTLYTIARLKSIPMNKTFLGAGYSYSGTLINNTNISGGIESMNILYKYI
ncbi:MAG: putative beta-lysine N-acetyltransferase [Prolixibacteraceae bacterium]|jgi:putative beta-lysine N-acetyltransferase|nr:putative beta-lysine N-acetyltransferase [Prolixibacteraceae bacterium]